MSLCLKNIALPLADFTLQVEFESQARVTALFGPSGAGKTSLLELIAGLRHANSAYVKLGERVLTDTSRKIFVPPQERHIGYVPQDLALFPHLSVRQNLLYGSKAIDALASPFRFDQVVEALEIQTLISHRVTELSGGEKQRVALARALLASPQLLLLDEPLASLDAPLKLRIRPLLVRIRDEFKVPMIYVTHDRYEALALAEYIVIITQGKVAQAGPIQNVFSHPATSSVAELLSVETVLPGIMVERSGHLVIVAVGSLRLTSSGSLLPVDAKAVHVCIRAEDVVLLKGAAVATSARNQFAGVIKALTPDGISMRADLDCGFPLVANLTRQACEELGLRPGDAVTALVKAPHVHLTPR
jgi:molybdate transport system ATP-binding protein